MIHVPVVEIVNEGWLNPRSRKTVSIRESRGFDPMYHKIFLEDPGEGFPLTGARAYEGSKGDDCLKAF